jgi:hypothetical protein
LMNELLNLKKNWCVPKAAPPCRVPAATWDFPTQFQSYSINVHPSLIPTMPAPLPLQNFMKEIGPLLNLQEVLH